MDKTTQQYVIWIIAVAVLISMLFLLLGMRFGHAELCLNRIDNSIEKRSGFRWQYRDVDGRRCWYYSNALLPKEDLIWSYESKDFDGDVDRVIERKFYGFDENNLLLERRREAK